MRLWVPDGIIFDLDGTLVDSAPEIAQALNKSLQHHAIDVFSLSEVKTFIGNGAPRLVARALAARGIDDPMLAARILAELLDTYEVSFDQTRLFPAVREVLAGITLPLAICTNKPARATAALLDHFDLARFFRAVVCGDTLAQRKPDPAPLWHAARLIGAQRPVMVGDSEVDSQAAAAARMPFVFFAGGYCNGPVTHHAKADDFDGMRFLMGNPVTDLVFP